MTTEFRLRTYQERARDAIVNDCVDYIKSSPEQTRVYGLMAPTGAGKTAIVSKAIKEINARLNGNVAFVWLTISSGDLDDQSKRSLEKHLNRSGIGVYSVQDALNTCPSNMASNVIVIGWSTINHDKDGVPDNIVMRPGDKTNFPEMCANTRDQNIPIALILDESHTHADTQRAKSRIDQFIQPTYILEVSATPTNVNNWHGAYKSAQNNTNRPGITYREVANAQMVKNEIYKQTFFQYKDGVREASKHLAYLIDLAKEVNAQFSPKMLIFIPNADNGIELNDILDLLRTEFSWTEESGDIKVVLASRKTDKWENTKVDNFDTTKVLITKEAIGTGVDIPSISMIVQLRPTKSVKVEVQKLGRGLRMPEQKHYNNDLDTLFFCVFNDHKLDFDGVEFLKDQFKHEAIIKPEIRDIINTFRPIDSIYYERIASFKEVSEDEFEDEFYEPFLARLRDADTTIGYFDKSEKHSEVIASGSIDLDLRKQNIDIASEQNLTGEDISVVYPSRVKGMLKHLFRYIDIIERAIEEFLNLNVEPEEYAIRVNTFILNNLSHIEALIFEMVKKIEDRRDDTREELGFTYVPPNKYEFVGEKEERSFKSYAYNHYYLDNEQRRSEVEERFEPYMDRHGVWWKNYDRKYGMSFSVQYTGVDGKKKNFFPDYILLINGKTFVLETKSGNLDAETNNKRNALVAHLASFPNANAIGGIVRMEHDHFYLDRGNGNEPLDNLLT